MGPGNRSRSAPTLPSGAPEPGNGLYALTPGRYFGEKGLTGSPMKRTLFYLMTLLGVLWLQMAGNYFAGSSGFSVDAILIVVLYFGLSRGPLAGEMLGFAWGLLMDASGLGLIGLHAFLYAGS